MSALALVGRDAARNVLGLLGADKVAEARRTYMAHLASYEELLAQVYADAGRRGGRPRRARPPGTRSPTR